MDSHRTASPQQYEIVRKPVVTRSTQQPSEGLLHTLETLLLDPLYVPTHCLGEPVHSMPSDVHVAAPEKCIALESTKVFKKIV